MKARAALDSVEIELVPDEMPDVSWLTDPSRYEGEPDAAKYAAQDAERLDAFNRGDWIMVGVRLRATVDLAPDDDGRISTIEITTPGLWGVESDSGENYFREIAADETAYLRDDLAAIGIELDADVSEMVVI
jgi:hypothetical protein